MQYSEGTVFLVPLRVGGYSRGILARKDSGGNILFGYFFAPRIETTSEVPFNDLSPRDALLRIRFGALGLRDGTWPILGRLPDWKRSDWGMPDFIRRDPLGIKKPRLIRYADGNTNLVEVDDVLEEDPGLQTDSLYGSGSVEITLTLLCEN